MTAADLRLLDEMRAQRRQELAKLLDESQDAARHERADEITDGRFTPEWHKLQ